MRRSVQSFTWPLDKSNVENHIARLELAKKWVILIVMTDSAPAIRNVYAEVVGLARPLQADLNIREREKLDQANKDLARWLAPMGPEKSHL